jgi:hypothetical protein
MLDIQDIQAEAQRLDSPTPAQRRALYRMQHGKKLVARLTKQQASKLIDTSISITTDYFHRSGRQTAR